MISPNLPLEKNGHNEELPNPMRKQVKGREELWADGPALCPVCHVAGQCSIREITHLFRDCWEINKSDAPPSICNTASTPLSKIPAMKALLRRLVFPMACGMPIRPIVEKSVSA